MSKLKLAFSIGLLLSGLSLSSAHSQNQISICVQGPGGCTPVNTLSPFPVSGGGGGGSGGVVTQGAQDATAAAWKMVLYQGGSLLTAANPIFVGPQTGSVWPSSAAPNAYADGANVTQGTKADAAITSLPTTASMVSILKGIFANTVSNDPCTTSAKTNFAFGQTATNIQIVPVNAGSNKVYICYLDYRVGSATNISIIEGGSTTCTSPAAVKGSITAANGLPEAANSGEASGSGIATIMKTQNINNGVCILSSASVLISGNVVYVQAP